MNNAPHDSWMPMRMYPPEACETYDIQLEDGTACRAFWTGVKWWRNKALVHPVAWRPATPGTIEMPPALRAAS